MRKELKSKSKFLSLVLRHNPTVANVTLDENGWCEVASLLHGAQSAGVRINRNELIEIVETNEKQRFRLNDDETQIRANQGHSIKVELGLPETAPPPILFHGTTIRFAEAIRAEGLQKMKRQHVHLSSDLKTAQQVGRRHGKVLVLQVDAQSMRAADHKFFLSENGVWLVDSVPAKFLTRIDEV